MAQFGLALCSEELGQTDQAAEVYGQIVAEESYKATVLPKQAQARLDALDDNIETFNFAEVPVAIENLVPEPIDSSMAVTPEETTETGTELSAEEVPEPAENL